MIGSGETGPKAILVGKFPVGSGIFLLLLLLTIWDRWRVMSNVATIYTDQDQVLIWTAAYEFINGRFHEPRFFGQAYNSLMEGMVAVVPVALGLPYHVAAPLVTIVLSLVPFAAMGICALRLGCPVSATLFMALPVLLPFEYAVITSMPRGFVTGIFIASLPACMSLFSAGRASFFVSGFLLTLSLSLNPNAVVIALPVGVSLVLTHRRSKELYIWGGVGTALACILDYLSVAFYTWNPAHLVYNSPDILSLEWALLRDGLIQPGRFLSAVTPVVDGQTWPLTLLFVLALVALIVCRSYRHAIALLAGIALVVLSFSMSRLHVLGSDSVYYHWSRAYLAVPLLLGLAWFWAEQAAAKRLGAGLTLSLIVVLGVLTFVVFGGRESTLEGMRERSAARGPNAWAPRWSMVRPHPVTEISRRCEALREISESSDAKLVVFRDEPVLAYACEPLLDRAIRTLQVPPDVQERRTWRLLEESRLRPRRIILYDFTAPQIARARSMGVEVEPGRSVDGVDTVVIKLPEQLDIFAFFESAGVFRGRDLRGRVQRLRGG